MRYISDGANETSYGLYVKTNNNRTKKKKNNKTERKKTGDFSLNGNYNYSNMIHEKGILTIKSQQHNIATLKKSH